MKEVADIRNDLFGNLLSENDYKQKLELLVEIARQVPSWSAPRSHW